MKKVFSIILSAIAFGIIAAAVMIGVNFVAKDFGILQPQTQVVESETTTTQRETESQRTQTIYKSSSTEDIVELVDKTMPSVVAITNVQKYIQNGFSIFGFRQQSREVEVPASGSGVIVGITDDEVIILTNNHVVESSSSLSVTFQDNEDSAVSSSETTTEDANDETKKGIEANIKGTDSDKDLAVISVATSKIPADVLKKLKAVELGDSDKIKVGERVVAIGNALGIGQSVTTGIVSAKDRVVDGINESEKLIQTDAAINPGNSGGALLNMEGELIGINVAKTSGTAIEGMGYAIPINTAKEVIDTMSNKKAREKVPENEQGFLGITARNIDSQTAESLGMPEGIYVFKISEGSAAASSEMKEKDIIVAIDDQKVKTLSELQEYLKYTRSGQEVKIQVKRLDKGEYVEKEFTMALGKRNVETATESNTESSKSSSNQETQPQGNDYFDDDFFDRFFGGGFGW